MSAISSYNDRRMVRFVTRIASNISSVDGMESSKRVKLTVTVTFESEADYSTYGALIAYIAGAIKGSRRIH
jgi:hypothetical protein